MKRIRGTGCDENARDQFYRILLVGGTGVIGSQIAEHFLALTLAARAKHKKKVDGSEAANKPKKRKEFLFPLGGDRERGGEADHHKGNKIEEEKEKNDNKLTAIQATSQTEEKRKTTLEQAREASFEVLIAGRNEKKGKDVIKRLQKLAGQQHHQQTSQQQQQDSVAVATAKFTARYVKVDHRDKDSLTRVFAGVDLVIHSASPFQRQRPMVLQASLEAGAHYLDLCGDSGYCESCKTECFRSAEMKGIAAVTGGGVIPGISNVMAGRLIQSFLNADVDVDEVKLRYFVAGSGGLGPTPLAGTLLVAGKPNIVYRDSKPVVRPFFSSWEVAHFLEPVGRRVVCLYDQSELHSIHRNFEVPNVSVKFGISPSILNLVLFIYSLIHPKMLFRCWTFVEYAAFFINPFIRFIDHYVGRAVGVTVEVRGSDGRIRTAYYTHNDTRVSTATCSVAMAIELLAGNVRPGVWYPEEAYHNNPNVLLNALKNCHTYRESERVLSQREIPKRRQQQLPKEEGGGEGETRKERERGRERKKERRRIAWGWRFVVGGAMIALLFIVLSWWLYE